MSARRIANWAIRSARGRSWRSGLSRRRASSPKSPLSTVRAELVEAPSFSAAQRRTALRPAQGKREQGFLRFKIGRAQCRDRVCNYVSILVDTESIKKNKKNTV